MGIIRKRQLEAVYEAFVRIAVAFAVCWLITLLAGCRSVETVRAPEIHSDTVIQTRWRTDSVVMRDSVVITETAEGRTKFVVRWRDRVRTVADTSYICITDSVPVPYPVEKQLGKWGQAKVDYGGYALVAVIILLTLAIWLARRLTRLTDKCN